MEEGGGWGITIEGKITPVQPKGRKDFSIIVPRKIGLQNIERR